MQTPDSGLHAWPRRRLCSTAAHGGRGVLGGRQFCPPALTSAGAERRPEQCCCRESVVLTFQPDGTCMAPRRRGRCVPVSRLGKSRGPSRATPSPPPASLTPLGSHCLEAPLGRGLPSSWWVSPSLSLGTACLSHHLEQRQTLSPSSLQRGASWNQRAHEAHRT